MPFFIYLYYLSPSVQLEDAGELTAAVLTWGIPHPSGYPLYVLLAGVWSRLWGGGAWAVNLFSALVTSLACLFIYLSAKRLGASSWAAVLGAWLAAGYPAIWSQALVAEVYALHIALTALLIYLLARFKQRPSLRAAYLIFLVAGLAVSNHLMSVFLLPAVGVIVWRNLKINLISSLKAAGCFIFGLLPYLYLPWRASQAPLLNWGEPASWHNFWVHVLRLNYHDFGLAAPGSKFGILTSLLSQIIAGLGWPIISLIVLGSAILIINKKSVVAWLMSLSALQSLPIILLRSFGWGIGLDFTYRVYWSGAVAALAVLAALAIHAVWQFVLGQRYGESQIFKLMCAVIVILALPWAVWLANVKFISYRQDNFPADYVRELLLSLPARAVLYVGGDGYSGDSSLFLITYAHIAEQLRPDVTVIDGGPLFIPAALKSRIRPVAKNEGNEILQQRWLRAAWQYAETNHRPLYSTSLVGVNMGLVGRPDGYAYRIFGSAAEARLAQVSPKLFGPAAWTIERMNSYSGQDFLASLNYHAAATLAEQKRKSAALAALLTAINYDNESFSAEYMAYVYQRSRLNW